MKTVLKDISVKFDNYTALNNINLEINEGEFIAILGPSGCGKTTLLRLLAGFLKPTGGEIYIGDEKIADEKFMMPSNKRNIGMVFQSYALWPHMTVKKNIEFPIVNGINISKEIKSNKENIVKDLINMVGLNGLENRYANELSGGQRQRVAIARGLASHPRILLMDEPLSNLDAELKIEMRREIKRIHKETNTTIIYVTHDQSEALAMADKIVVLNKGILQQFGTPKEIYNNPETPFVAKFVGRTNLIKGSWNDNNEFTPTDSDMKIFDEKVPNEFIKNNCYPIKPESLSVTNDISAKGIEGSIVQIEYQGQNHKVLIKLKNDDIVESYYWGKENIANGDKVKVVYE